MSTKPSENLQRCHDIIAAYCDDIAALFKDPMKVTVIVRHPEHPDGTRDVVVSSDEYSKAIEAVQRLLADPSAVHTGPPLAKSQPTFLARDKFNDPVEFRRNGAVVEYRYTNGGNGGRWKEPTWEIDQFTPSEREAYQAAQLSSQAPA